MFQNLKFNEQQLSLIKCIILKITRNQKKIYIYLNLKLFTKTCKHASKQTNKKPLSHYQLILELTKIFIVTCSIAILYKSSLASVLLNAIILFIFFVIFLFTQSFTNKVLFVLRIIIELCTILIFVLIAALSQIDKTENYDKKQNIGQAMIYICEFGFLLFSMFQITLNIIHRVFTKPIKNPIDVSPAKEYMDAKIIA